MVKMEFVPHISREILLGPSISQSEKCMAILRWKGVSISNVRLLGNPESIVRNRRMTLSMPHPWPKISCDKKGCDMVI